MRINYPKCVIAPFIVLFLAWTISCSGRPDKKNTTSVKPVEISNAEVAVRLINMISPDENSGFKLKENIKVVLGLEDKTKLPDSILISFNGRAVTTLKSGSLDYTIPSVFTNATGRKSLKAVSYKGGRQQNTITRFMIIYSDIVPKKYGYKVVNSYPHDKEAFTQGLVYDNGLFFEGTGEAGSNLREVELKTGRINRQHNLDGSLFGEGITLFQNRIFEVTWKNKIGFVYEKSTFKLINKIYYPTEGWGLTTLNDKIVLSDGSNILYFYEPETFTETARIEVYDNEHKVDSLNELEYINGEIWANIWMNNHIARIDPITGKVLAYIDLNGILPASERDAETDCLNGIAYDPDGKRIFVTGKRWPKLYEIKLTE